MLPAGFSGPPVPRFPALITRDDQGRGTMRAVRLTTPLRVDGKLDEALYSTYTPVGDFVQNEPTSGAPATEKSEVWLSFDRTAVYVSFRLWESQPERMILNEMRRDSFNILQNEGIAFFLDTFYDRRNGVLFNLSPLGARMDGQVTNERTYNPDWNPIWRYAVGRFEGGWTVEAAIPFKSLRYRSGATQVWGFSARRTNRWKNELSFMMPVPKGIGNRGIFMASLAATVVGLEVPSGSRLLEVKPYAIASATTDRVATPALANDLTGDVGVDAKVALTQNLTADLTYNTDFAQVEADEQQVNLTRFSLFFPEKREFFLENQGIFQFGGAGGGGGNQANTSDTPLLFYSRRIGLTSGRQVPIQVGGRLTGRIGRYSIGAINIRTDDLPSAKVRGTNFSVFRVRRDFLRRSSFGVLATHRSVAANGVGANATVGGDATFAFFDNLAINAHWAQTHTEGRNRENVSYRTQLDYAGDRYGVQVERLVVGDNFNPEVGFVRRDDMYRNFAQFRFSPRPRRVKAVRKFIWTTSLNYIEDGRGRVSTREADGEFGIEFQNSDRFAANYTQSYELLTGAFAIDPHVTIPAGGYGFGTGRIEYQLGQQRKLAGSVSLERGTFYAGHRTTLAYSRARVEVTPHLAIEPNISVNWVDLPFGSFTAGLVGSRFTYTITPMMFLSALTQFNSTTHVVGTNARLRWEYHPGSELFVVYNDERETDRLVPTTPVLRNRTIVVKVNRFFRF